MKLIFATSVDASNYIANFGFAKGAMLWAIDYKSNAITFSLIAEDDTISSVVNGITGDPADQATAAADIRAVVAATNP